MMFTVSIPSATVQPSPPTPPLCPSLQGPGACQLYTWPSSTSHAVSSTYQSTSSVTSVDANTQSNTSTMNTSLMDDSASPQNATTADNSTTCQNTAFTSPLPLIHPSISPDASSSTNSNWSLKGLSHQFWQAWQGFKEGPLKFIFMPGKWLGRRVKASVSFDMVTMIMSLVLVIVFGYPAWKALNLQIWTGKKDFLEYCNDNSTLQEGRSKLDCETAIKAGLPPPPGRVKRTAMKLRRSVVSLIQYRSNDTSKTRASIILSKPDAERRYSFLERSFEASSHHFVPTLLFWCAVSILLATLIRKTGKRIRWSIRHGPRNSLLSSLYLLPTTTFATLLTAFVLSENYRWINDKQMEAEIAYQRYCHRLPILERPSTCAMNSFAYPSSSNAESQEAWGFSSYKVGLAAITLASLAISLSTITIIQLMRRIRSMDPKCDPEAALEVASIEPQRSAFSNIFDLLKRSKLFKMSTKAYSRVKSTFDVPRLGSAPRYPEILVHQDPEPRHEYEWEDGRVRDQEQPGRHEQDQEQGQEHERDQECYDHKDEDLGKERDDQVSLQQGATDSLQSEIDEKLTTFGSSTDTRPPPSEIPSTPFITALPLPNPTTSLFQSYASGGGSGGVSYRWMCCTCGAENNCIYDDLCPKCRRHLWKSCCYVY